MAKVKKKSADNDIFEHVVFRFTRLGGKHQPTLHTLVVDDSVEELAAGLEDAGYNVIKFPKGVKRGERIKAGLLHGRIIVTKNSRRLRKDATKHRCAIIALDGLDFIDSSPTIAQNKTAQYVDRGFKKHKLDRVAAMFLLEIKRKPNTGKPKTSKGVTTGLTSKSRGTRKSAARGGNDDDVVYVFHRSIESSTEGAPSKAKSKRPVL